MSFFHISIVIATVIQMTYSSCTPCATTCAVNNNVNILNGEQLGIGNNMNDICLPDNAVIGEK